jgi:GT2 family glycosyltransferase
MGTPTAIVIPAHNQLEYCRQCVESIWANTQPPYRLVLVDNGSTDGVGEYFDSVPDATVIHAKSNRGFAGGTNLGLAEVDGHALVLNSDTIVPSGWLGRLEAALLEAPDVGMVGPMSNYVSGPQQIDGLAIESLAEIDVFAAELANTKQGQRRDVERLVGFCLLIRDTVLRDVGLFDESFGMGNFEDDDYCLRARNAGYRLRIAEDAFVFHYGNRTFLSMGISDYHWDELIAANRRRFLEKWQRDPDERDQAAMRAATLNCEARAAFEQEDFAASLALLQQSIEADPLFERNYNDLGVILWEMGDQVKAYANFARAVRLNMHYSEARENLREAAAVLGKDAEAQGLLSE